MPQIAVLIPCYNEAMTIKKVVEDFRRALPDAAVYVYDNNSSDNTAEIAESAGATVRREHQQGKGNVVRRMFQEIEADCYIIADGDDAFPCEVAPELARRVLEEKRDMVIGDRLSTNYFSDNTRRFHGFGNSLVRFCINKIFKSNVKDVMTGYRAFSRRFVKTFPVVSKGFEIETEMTIHAISMNMAFAAVPITTRERPAGSVSSMNTVRDGAKVLLTIFNLFKNYRPLLFFSLIAFALLALAAAAFFPAVWIPYLRTSRVDNFPTLIVCGFTALAALLSFWGGLILDSIMQKERREFEFRLMTTEMLKK